MCMDAKMMKLGMSYFRHIVKKTGLSGEDNLGKVEGRRKRRPNTGTRWIDSLEEFTI